MNSSQCVVRGCVHPLTHTGVLLCDEALTPKNEITEGSQWSARVSTQRTKKMGCSKAWQWRDGKRREKGGVTAKALAFDHMHTWHALHSGRGRFLSSRSSTVAYAQLTGSKKPSRGWTGGEVVAVGLRVSAC